MQIYQPDTTAEAGAPAYPYTNDNGLDRVYDELARFNEEVPPQATDCAVIVGSGGLLSMADVLPQTICVTDKDTRLLEWTAKNVAAILKCDDRKGYVQTAPHYPSDAEGEILKYRHFRASPERYAVARQAIARCAISYVNMDYGLPGDIEGLADFIAGQDKSIRVFNATNMHRYIEREQIQDDSRLGMSGYIAALEALPWATNFLIASSAVDLLLVQSLPTQTSLEGYKNGILTGHPRTEVPRRRTWPPLKRYK